MTAVKIGDMDELVVPLDGREESVRAVPVAGRLASRLGLSLRLFAASDDQGPISSWMQRVGEKHLDGMDVTYTVTRPETTIEETIVEAAGERGLVCMATAASLRPHQGHVGSVAEGVVRRIDRPVFLVGPDMEPSPGEHTRRVIIPVDGSPLSESALDVGGDLAATLGVQAWVVSVVPHRTEMVAQSRLGAGTIASESGYVRGLALRLAERHAIDAEYEVLHWDDPARALVDFAGDDGTVVMSTHGRSGLNRVFGGSVATGVVAHSHRAVLVWRPAESD